MDTNAVNDTKAPTEEEDLGSFILLVVSIDTVRNANYIQKDTNHKDAMLSTG